jgi:hypothetical protein
MKVGLRSINKEGREQGKKFGVEQYEMRTFSRDREHLENLVRPSHALCGTFSFYFCMLISKSPEPNKNICILLPKST